MEWFSINFQDKQKEKIRRNMERRTSCSLWPWQDHRQMINRAQKETQKKKVYWHVTPITALSIHPESFLQLPFSKWDNSAPSGGLFGGQNNWQQWIKGCSVAGHIFLISWRPFQNVPHNSCPDYLETNWGNFGLLLQDPKWQEKKGQSWRFYV